MDSGGLPEAVSRFGTLCRRACFQDSAPSTQEGLEELDEYAEFGPNATGK